ncbi:uncharacterized protein E5676_scaffold772G00170 [Cucumis melo var. makuwa]|uniref:Retrotransposon gag domain-containing protein n=1 Tax=Cucumis melo var. makuwa TaxID=1194695 RepID=A0A5A7VJK6_CUCMM|nr:uncharacterized protein E6C27_scaffold90G001050 [Cucumis melo var. makuwa]TYK01433.1 uncharacterized protein E5676_scaffold772G00170 [Cucumis melo var. makuwa]
MRAMANQVPVGGTVPVTKVKVPEPKRFCGVRDAKALKNFIFDLEQYFKATNTVTEEAKVTLTTMYLCEDAKLWWRSRYMDIQEGRCTIDTWDVLKERQSFLFVEGLKLWARAKLYEQRVQDLTSAYAAAERLFDLTSNSQDVRRHQCSSPGRNRNSRPSSPKAVEGDECPGSDDSSNQAEDEVDQIDGGFRKNEGREFCCPTYCRTSEANDDKVGRMERSRTLCGCKDGRLRCSTGMEFLLEHQVIPMPLAKCLAITESFPMVVQADIRQPNGFKMISTMQLDEGPAQEEPSSAAILLGALEKPGETVSKDTLCVSEKCHDVLPNSWPKSVSMRRTINHE